MPNVEQSITVTRPVNNANAVNNNETSTMIEVDTGYEQTPCCPGLWIEAGILAAIVIVGIFGFIKSVKSRKYYRCTGCGESFRSENMDSKTCKVCGAELEEVDDKNVSDKTK